MISLTRCYKTAVFLDLLYSSTYLLSKRHEVGTFQWWYQTARMVFLSMTKMPSTVKPIGSAFSPLINMFICKQSKTSAWSQCCV